MNREQFEKKYMNFGWNESIIVPCSTPGCPVVTSLKKQAARTNIDRHDDQFLCRKCCYTDEGKEKISQATSYKRSEETKKKMSEGRKKFFESEEGQKEKEKLSKLTALGHTKNKYENAKRQGWFPSVKNGKMVFYGSSYELRLIWELDQEESVASFEVQIGYEWQNRGRCLDLLVTYKDGRKVAIEVKPKDRLNEEAFILQLNDSREHALSNGWEFKIYTEDDLGMTYTQIRNWADKYRTNLTGFDYEKHRKENNSKNAKKHYANKIATDTVDVYCDFCQETHTALRLTHDKNIERNGRYICEREGGHIAGSKPKLSLRKENPYAAEGKKQCTKCQEVKPFAEFSTDKSRRDGLASRCIQCRSNEYLEKKGS